MTIVYLIVGTTKGSLFSNLGKVHKVCVYGACGREQVEETKVMDGGVDRASIVHGGPKNVASS